MWLPFFIFPCPCPWYKKTTHWKRLWCCERLRAGGERDNRGWDGWMASPTHWTWVRANSRREWRTGKPGVLQSMGSQRVSRDWMTQQQQMLLLLQLCRNPKQSVFGRRGSAGSSWSQPRIRTSTSLKLDRYLLLLLSHFSRVWLCATPWTAAHQAPPSTGFSRQEY